VFEWDDGNVEHIAQHGVTPEEAEDAFVDTRRRGLPAYNVGNERRWAFIGNAGGRLLFVVYTRRGSRIRVVAARDAELAERRQYRKK